METPSAAALHELFYDAPRIADILEHDIEELESNRLQDHGAGVKRPSIYVDVFESTHNNIPILP